MAQYRKVDTCIWNDEKFSKLSDRAKLAFLLILTHPNMTSFGCMRATVGGLAAELGWLSEGYQEGYREPFEELLSLGLVVVDDKAAFFAVPNFLKYNRPDGPKVVIGWGKLLYLLPECRSKYLYFQRVRETLKGYGIGLEKALPKGFSNTQNSELRTQNSIRDEPQASAESLEVSPPTPSPEIASSDSPATNGKPKGRDKSRRVLLLAADIAIPEFLDTPQVRESLDEWLAYKHERREGYKDAKTAARLFAQFAEYGRDGPEVFIAAVNYSIANDYKGLIVPDYAKSKFKSRPTARIAAATYDPGITGSDPF